MSENLGSPGPAKEGIVLGREDLNRPAEHGGGAGMRTGMRRIRVYRGGWWLPIVLGIGIPAMFVFGMFVITALMTVGIVFWLLRSLVGGGGSGKSAGRAVRGGR